MKVSDMERIQKQVGTKMFERAVFLGLTAAMQEINPRCERIQILELVAEVIDAAQYQPFFE